MTVPEQAKKVAALLAVIDDTEQQIAAVSSTIKQQIQNLKNELEERTRELKQSLKENYDLLEQTAIASRERSYVSDTDRLKARAMRFIGEQVVAGEPNVDGTTT